MTMHERFKDNFLLAVFPPHRELIVDFFAGGGGASTGIELALGRSPDIAVNHDAEAVAMHRINHPSTIHLQHDVWQVWPVLSRLIGNHSVGLLWASPDCKHFSKAKGGKPVKRKIRDLAWVVVKFARTFRPRVIALENVEEFRDWGPLVQKTDADGFKVVDLLGNPVMVPCKARKGQTFQEWVAGLQRLGYRVEWRELRASKYRTPTIRKRLKVIARRDGLPIVWPAPTNDEPNSHAVQSGRLLPYRTAAEDVIDWSLPCHSIFLSKEDGRAVGVKRPLVRATMARLAKGVSRFVLKAQKPFLVSLTHHGSDRNEDIDDPMRTVTAAHRGEKALVTPYLTKFNTGAVGSSVDEPVPTVTANSFIKRAGGAPTHGLAIPYLVPRYGERDGQEPRTLDVQDPISTVVPTGNGASLAVPFIAAAQHGGSHRSADEPVHTVTASRKDQNQVIVPVIAGCGGRMGQTEPRSGDTPLQTLTAKADSVLAAPMLASLYSERHEDDARISDVDAPSPTVTATPRHALVSPHLMTMRNAEKPFNCADQPTHTITAGGAHLNQVSAFLAQNNIDGRTGEGHPGRAADEPMSTVMSSGSHQSVVAAHLARQFGAAIGSALDQPMRTVMSEGAGGKTAVTAAFLQKYYGTGEGQRVDQPAHTVTTKDRLGLAEVLAKIQPFSEAHKARARQVADLLREFGLWDEREFVTLAICGFEFVIVDIGMRMLVAAELYRAQGFPCTYIINRGIFIGEDGLPFEKKLTATAAIRMCGNSVCPPVAEALIAANCAFLRIERLAA